jgi:glycosyltransferase involved in cell wall biosynthesis
MTRPLHIISVNQDPGIDPGRKKGAAVHLEAMRAAFRQLGLEVTAIDEPDPRRLHDRLQLVARRQAVDVVYERYSLGRATAARFARAGGIPYVLEVNAPLAAEQERWRGLAESERDRGEDAATFGSAGFVAAVSTQVAAYAWSRGAPAESVFVCPNGIDTGLFRPVADEQPVPPLPLPEDAFVLGFHGRERPWHGFDMLVEATRTLLRERLPVHLLVIGEGEFSSLSALQAGNYTRLPWVAHERIPALLRHYDAAPLTYPRDAPCYFSPLKLAEAMACGAVPVVPDLGDLPVIVKHRRNGLVYAAGQLDSLVEALLSLITQPSLKSALAAAAAETALAHGWDRTALRILNHFGLAREHAAEVAR